MSIATISQTISRGDVSTYLAANDNAKGSLFGTRINAAKGSAVSIALITDALRWGYDSNSGAQTDANLREVANYLIWLCGKYGQQAQFILEGAGGGTVVPSGGSGFSFVYLIPITASDFANATDYNDTRIVGKELQIFWNNVNRYLETSEFAYTATGIQILISGFDAKGANSDAEFKIYIVDPSGTTATPTTGVSIYTYIGTGGETFFTNGVLINKTVSALTRGTPYEVITVGVPTDVQALSTQSLGRIDFALSNPIIAGELILVFYS